MQQLQQSCSELELQATELAFRDPSESKLVLPKLKLSYILACRAHMLELAEFKEKQEGKGEDSNLHLGTVVFLTTKYIAACSQYAETLKELTYSLGLIQIKASSTTLRGSRDKVNEVQRRLTEAAGKYEKALLGIHDTLEVQTKTLRRQSTAPPPPPPARGGGRTGEAGVGAVVQQLLLAPELRVKDVLSLMVEQRREVREGSARSEAKDAGRGGGGGSAEVDVFSIFTTTKQEMEDIFKDKLLGAIGDLFKVRSSSPT